MVIDLFRCTGKVALGLTSNIFEALSADDKHKYHWFELMLWLNVFRLDAIQIENDTIFGVNKVSLIPKNQKKMMITVRKYCNHKWPHFISALGKRQMKIDQNVTQETYAHIAITFAKSQLQMTLTTLSTTTSRHSESISILCFHFRIVFSAFELTRWKWKIIFKDSFEPKLTLKISCWNWLSTLLALSRMACTLNDSVSV